MSHKVTGGISKYYGFLDFMVNHGYMIKTSDGSYEWSDKVQSPLLECNETNVED